MFVASAWLCLLAAASSTSRAASPEAWPSPRTDGPAAAHVEARPLQHVVGRSGANNNAGTIGNGRTGAASRVAAIELRGEAIVNDGNVTLRQICRWPEADEPTFAGYAELIVLRLPQGRAFGEITIEQVQTMLRDAGLNPGAVNFAGATACTVNRADVVVDEAAALEAWGGRATASPARPATPVAPAPGAADAPADASRNADAAPQAAEVVNLDDLKTQLIADAASRLRLPVDSLQVDFRPEDRGVLSMGRPFEFQIVGQRYGDLGETSWLVTITGPGGNAQPATTGGPANANGDSNVGDGRRVRITANVRAWMDQAIVTRAMAAREPIDAGNIEAKRVLADRLPSDPWLTVDQALGQQATRDVRPGTILSGRLVSPVELVRPGQLVTVYMRRGAIEVKSVARALQSGTNGQLVKLKNESTGDVYTATVTGRQTATVGAQQPVADVR